MGLAAFTVVILRNRGHYLLLHRAPTKRLHPNLWTGVGGRVEADEYENISGAAYRELEEETGISPAQLSNFLLRRTIIHARPGGPMTVLCYFTGDLSERVSPKSDEGRLAWVSPQEMEALPFIDNMGATIPLLVADMEAAPNGVNTLPLGVALYQPNGEFKDIVWA